MIQNTEQHVQWLWYLLFIGLPIFLLLMSKNEIHRSPLSQWRIIRLAIVNGSMSVWKSTLMWKALDTSSVYGVFCIPLLITVRIYNKLEATSNIVAFSKGLFIPREIDPIQSWILTTRNSNIHRNCTPYVWQNFMLFLIKTKKNFDTK